MTLDLQTPGSNPEIQALNNEIARLNKIIRALMDRAERSTCSQSSDFGQFQVTIMLEEQVRLRTAELEAALVENERINHALRISEAKFRGVVTQSLVGIVIIEDGKFSYSNAKFDEIFGYSADEIRQLGPLDVVTVEDRPIVQEKIRLRLAGEEERLVYLFHGVRKDGTVINIEVHSGSMESGGKTALIGLVMDVTERTRAENEMRDLQQKLMDQSTHDALTGLYNRRYMEEALNRELLLAERQGNPLSVIMADLDHFKSVNDRYGHQAGDEVLRSFGALLRRHARSSDIYCRYGGEEFLLVLPGMPLDMATERAELLRQTVAATPVLYEGTPIALTASLGVAVFPHDSRTGEELISTADKALYMAKISGRNRVEVGGGLVTQ